MQLLAVDFYFTAELLYMFRVFSTPIIRSKQNCIYSFRYRSYVLQLATSNVVDSNSATLEVGRCKIYDLYRRL